MSVDRNKAREAKTDVVLLETWLHHTIERVGDLKRCLDLTERLALHREQRGSHQRATACRQTEQSKTRTNASHSENLPIAPAQSKGIPEYSPLKKVFLLLHVWTYAPSSRLQQERQNASSPFSRSGKLCTLHNF